MLKKKLVFLAVALSTATITCNVNADGLADLNKALSQLKGESNITASLESAYSQQRGRKKKIKNTSGLANVLLSDGENGLQVTYSNETLLLLDKEENEKQADEEVDTPTLNAINDIEASELSNMLSAAADLRRSIAKAEYLKEELIMYQGSEVRRLAFDLPLDAIISDKEVRSYVDDFNGSYHVIIDEEGVPLKTKLNFEGKGSIYLFFKLSINQSMTSFYSVVDDRLVNHRKQFDRMQNSTWGKRDSSGYKALEVKSNANKLAYKEP